MDFKSMFGKSDGASFRSKAAMKEAGVGPYDAPPPPPPPPPPISSQKSQVGNVDIQHSKKLEDALIARGMSKEEAQGKMKAQAKSTGVNYK